MQQIIWGLINRFIIQEGLGRMDFKRMGLINEMLAKLLCISSSVSCTMRILMMTKK